MTSRIYYTDPYCRRFEAVVTAVARSPDLSFDANAVVRALVERFGGRGGGKADLAQGGGLVGVPVDLASFARTILSVS